MDSNDQNQSSNYISNVQSVDGMGHMNIFEKMPLRVLQNQLDMGVDTNNLFLSAFSEKGAIGRYTIVLHRTSESCPGEERTD